MDTCAAEFEAYTPYYYSTYGTENEIRAGTKRKIMILGGGPNRDRAGNRVRLLLRARRFRAARARIRNHHGELESGNGFDRLRHERQTLLRAAHTRRRAQYLRPGKTGRRDCAVRRTDAAQSRERIARGRRSDHRHAAGKHRNGGRPQTFRRDARQARLAPNAKRHRGQRRRRRRDRADGSVIRCSFGHHSFSADARWSWFTTTKIFGVTCRARSK